MPDLRGATTFPPDDLEHAVIVLGGEPEDVLTDQGDVGTGATQVARGNHSH